MRWLLALAGIVALALSLSSVGRRGGDDALFVYVGAGFRLPVEEVASRFREETGVSVELSFAGSGCLLAQAALSRRGDLYMPGEEFFMAQAREQGLITREADIAYMRPVILVPRGNPKNIEGVADLGRPGLRVGLGHPLATACGISAEEVLRGLPSQARVRANVIMNALNVNELGTAVALKALDAAIAWDATADLFRLDTEALAIPPKIGKPTTIPLGILSFTRRPEEARRFLEFMGDEQGGVAVFKEHGYETPGLPKAAPSPSGSAVL